MKKGVKSFVFTFFACVFVCAALFLATSTLFSVETVEIEGLSALKKKDVLAQAGLPPYGSNNFFLINSFFIRNKVLKMPYVAKCDVVKTFPGAITIKITERRVYGYIEDAGFYIYLDNEGRALDIKEYTEENLPVAVGLKYVSFKIGETLKAQDASVFNTLALLGSLFRSYGLNEYFIRANINDSSDIRLYLYNIEVAIGGVSEINDKIRLLKEVLANFQDLESSKGTLDLRTAYKNEAARFRPSK